MSETLARARLGDTALVSYLLLLLSGVHFSLLAVGRSHRFRRAALETAYRVCLLASWGPLAVGAGVLTLLCCVGRTTDKRNVSPATPVRLAVAAAGAAAVALGCVLLAAAEAFWIAEIGFKRFHVIILLGLLSLVLLLWVALQVAMVAREAMRVRKHVVAHPPMPEAAGGAAAAEDKVFP